MTFKYYKENSELSSAPKDAGTYSVQVTYETDTHYGQSDAVTFTIHPKAVTINKGTIHFEKAFDGNAETTGITPSGALGVNGVIGEDTVTVNYTKATFNSEKAGTRNILFEGISFSLTSSRPQPAPVQSCKQSGIVIGHPESQTGSSQIFGPIRSFHTGQCQIGNSRVLKADWD